MVVEAAVWLGAAAVEAVVIVWARQQSASQQPSHCSPPFLILLVRTADTASLVKPITVTMATSRAGQEPSAGDRDPRFDTLGWGHRIVYVCVQVQDHLSLKL